MKRPGKDSYKPPAENAYPYKRGWTNGRVGYESNRNPWLGIRHKKEESELWDRGWMDATGQKVDRARIPTKTNYELMLSLEENFLDLS